MILWLLRLKDKTWLPSSFLWIPDCHVVRTPKQPCGEIYVARNWGVLPQPSTHVNPDNHVNETSWNPAVQAQVGLHKAAVVGFWSGSHKRLRASTTQLNHSWIPGPQKPEKVIDVYHCFKSRSFRWLCDVAVDDCCDFGTAGLCFCNTHVRGGFRWQKLESVHGHVKYFE